MRSMITANTPNISIPAKTVVRPSEGVSIAKLSPPIIVRTEQHGRLYLRRVSMADTRYIYAVFSQAIEKREMMASILQHQISKPELSIDVLHAWPDRLLFRVGYRWIEGLTQVKSQRTSSTLSKLPKFKAKTFAADFVVALKKHIARQNKLAWETMASLSRSLMPRVDTSAITLPSSWAVSAKRAAQLSAMNTRIDRSSMVEALKQVQAQGSPYAEALRQIRQLQLPARSVARQFAEGIEAVNKIQTAPFFLKMAEVKREFQAVRERYSAVFSQMAEAQRAVGKMLEPYRNLAARLFIAPKLPLPFQLPDLSGISALLEQWRRENREELYYQEGVETLNDSEFAFLSMFASRQFLTDLGRLPEAERITRMTEYLFRISASREFFDNLESVFSWHPILQRRWAVIAEAMDVHGAGRFLLSIAVLYPQIEGLFTELLQARSEIALHPNSYVAKDALTGNPILNVNGDPIPLNGLSAKITYFKFDVNKNQYVDTNAVKFLKNVSKNRNVVSHGNVTNYADMTEATLLAWAVYVLAHAVAWELRRPTSMYRVSAMIRSRVEQPITLTGF